MSESHAADSPTDDERAKREAEEFRTKLKAALELVEQMSAALEKRAAPPVALSLVALNTAQSALLLWYIRSLQEGHRQVHHLLFNHISEMQHVKRTICPLY